MTGVVWHRLRGHTVRRYRQHVSLVPEHSYGIAMERGEERRGLECSCGERWPEP